MNWSNIISTAIASLSALVVLPGLSQPIAPKLPTSQDQPVVAEKFLPSRVNSVTGNTANLPSLPERSKQPQEQKPLPGPATPSLTETKEKVEPTPPQRLKVLVQINEPTDLKVREGQEIGKGEIIADRQQERERLTAQKEQLQLSQQRLKSTIITPPTPPVEVPTVQELPPISYQEQEAAIERGKTAVARIGEEIELKKQEIRYLTELEHLDPIILEHEQHKLRELEQNHSAAVRDYQLAVGKLQSARNERNYQEYSASIAAARRVEEANQAQMSYQYQLAEYEERLRNKEFQLTEVQTKLQNVENAIAQLSTTKAPYAGTVRRIKWLGQAPDGKLTAEVTLMVKSSRGKRSGSRRSVSGTKD